MNRRRLFWQVEKKEESYDKTYQQLLDGVRIELKRLGWEGDFRVLFQRYSQEVLANVRGLYDFAMIQLKQQVNPKFTFRQNRNLKDEKWEHYG